MTTKRAWLIPEVLQTSQMDCGPAALKAVLEGFGVSVHYDELRERCATDVDGTSIDALAQLANEYGLKSHQQLVARDSFLLREADCLPAIVVTRSAGGLLHFIVVWNTWGPFVQILDPGCGRRWLLKERFLETMPDIPIALSSAKWRRWAASQVGRAPLLLRLRRLGLSRGAAAQLCDRAALDSSWCGFATLDAGARMLTTLVASRALAKGRDAARFLASLLADSAAAACPSGERWSQVPPRFWWASAATPSAAKLTLRGCVVVHFGANAGVAAAARTDAPLRSTVSALPTARAQIASVADAPFDASATHWPRAALPASLERELRAVTLRPMLLLWKCARFDSGRLWVWLALAWFASAAVLGTETLVLHSTMGIDRYLRLDYQRALGLATALALVLGGLWLELWTGSLVQRIGRGLEMRLRVAFLEKLPRLPDKYLRSRPTSDMAARGHAIHHLREVPELWAQFARGVLTLLTTAAGLYWLYPTGWILIVSLSVCAILLPYLARRSVSETSMRLRTHASALECFYLDALLGVSPVRVHGAERTVRCGHEALLTEWVRTARSLQLQSSALQALQLVANTGLSLALVASYVRSGGPVGGLLLLAYWVLRVSGAAQELVSTQLALRQLRSVALRLLAPLAAADAAASESAQPALEQFDRRAVNLAFENVSVKSGGSSLLHELSLKIPAGSHIAIVGPSGAGKSSLLGLLLGWLSASEGQLRVDGEVLDAERVVQLRDRTAWVDPSVRLWEASLYDNLVFGDDRDPQQLLPLAMAGADLVELLETLPEGMQASLGEGGVRVSGGQGQRVRMARALMRKRAGLVLLDEPFRGLTREKRRAALRHARAHWQHATLLFVSHDVADTVEFERVLVLENGRIVEDGAPNSLLADPTSRYAVLVDSERTLRTRVWSSANFRQHVLRGGRLARAEAE